MNFSIVSALLRAVSGFLVFYVLSEQMSKELFAQFYLVVAVCSVLLAVLDFGAAQKYIYSKQFDDDQRSKMHECYFIGAMIFVVSSFLLSAAALFEGMAVWYVLLSAFFYVYFPFKSTPFRSEKEKSLATKEILKSDVVQFSLTMIMAIAAVYYVPSDLIPVNIVVLTAVPGLIYYMVISKGSHKYKVSRHLGSVLDSYLRSVRESVAFAINGGVFTFSQQIDIILVNLLFNTSAVANYTFAKTLISQLTNVIYAGVSRYSNAKLAGMVHKGTLTTCERRGTLVIHIAISLVTFVLIAIAYQFYIKVMFGDKWLATTYIAITLLLAMVFRVSLIPIIAEIIARVGIEKILKNNLIYCLVFALLAALSSLFNIEALSIDRVVVMSVVVFSIVTLFDYRRLSYAGFNSNKVKAISE